MPLAYDLVKRTRTKAFRKRDAFVRLSIRPDGEKALFYWFHAFSAYGIISLLLVAVRRRIYMQRKTWNDGLAV
jgi:hypothetical protein